MKAGTDSPLELTSTVIPFSPTGDYEFHQLGFLMAHEMLRRELRRTEEALKCLDCIKHPWKAKAISEWMNDLLLPIMHVHHYVEDDIIFPFYVSLNVLPPDRQTEDHTALVGRMKRLERNLRSLIKRVEGKSDPALILADEENLRNQFYEFHSHMLEEERYWPRMLKKCGAENWAKMEPIVLEETVKYGDFNAGEPFRMLICAIAHSMGIIVNGVGLEAGETRWAGAAIQAHYIKSRSGAKLSAWFKRYHGFLKLIQAVGSDSVTTIPVTNKQGKFVAKTPKPPAPAVLVILLSLYFCLCVAPYFAAIANPLRNLKYLQIAVQNADEGSLVGLALIATLNQVAASSDEIPTFRYYSADKPFEQMTNLVKDAEVWAAVVVAVNASSNLQQAFANDCANAGSYSASSGISFIWQEARNNIVAAPYIDGFMTEVLTTFTQKFAATYLAHDVSNATVAGCVSAGYSSLVVTPVSYTNTNLAPASRSYVVTNGGLTVGNILVAVFGSTFITNAAAGATAALCEDLSPYGRVALKAGTMLALGMALSVCLSTMIVGFTYHGSSGYLYNGQKWGQMFGVHWMHFIIWSFGHAWEAEALSLFLMPCFFGFLLLSSILGGWNYDLADPGYKHFYQIFPFHWEIYLQRWIYYDDVLQKKRGTSSGILVGYALFVFFGYVRIALINEFKRVSDKTYIKLDDDDNVDEKVAVIEDGGGDGSVEMVTTNEQKCHPVK